jgi:hypothetical protein
MASSNGHRARVWQTRLRRVGERAPHRLAVLYVAGFAWAVGTVAAQALPIVLIARLVLVLAVVIAIYATTVAFIVFVVCGRFGVVREARWRSRAATIAVAVAFAWIIVGACAEGRTLLNVAAIAAAELAGAGLYVGRRRVATAARRRLSIERRV